MKFFSMTNKIVVVQQSSSAVILPEKTTNQEIKKVKLLNIFIDNLSMEEFLYKLQRGVVFTPNVDHLIKLQTNKEFFYAYNQADYKICDSQILIYFAKFLGTPIKEKISGSDFFPAFCKHHQNNPAVTIFLLGSAEGVAQRAREEINRKLNRNIIIASHSPSYGFEKNEKECLEIIEMINGSMATVLAIGVGAPKQELWITKYKHLMPNIKIFLAVGATIDFEANHKPRAPKWMSQTGLEWLYRLVCEPRRLWKRYLIDDIPCFWLILKQKFNIYKSPFEII
jgi:N-acetylglucosaminyldiphosphoundecaprenol N-acetyl-beta-D-mannosaminyltransferase